jgi:two-component system nitrogen regulation response regulator GlnG
MKTKDLTITQVEELISSLEAKVEVLESQITEYQKNAEKTNITWRDLLRTEIIQMLVDKDDAIKQIGAEAEHVLIKTALEFNCNRRQETAIILGYGRNTITKKVTELNIQL